MAFRFTNARYSYINTSSKIPKIPTLLFKINYEQFSDILIWRGVVLPLGNLMVKEYFKLHKTINIYYLHLITFYTRVQKKIKLCMSTVISNRIHFWPLVRESLVHDLSYMNYSPVYLFFNYSQGRIQIFLFISPTLNQ